MAKLALCGALAVFLLPSAGCVIDDPHGVRIADAAVERPPERVSVGRRAGVARGPTWAVVLAGAAKVLLPTVDPIETGR